MILLIYLIKTILISGMLFAYFMLFLRNRSFHDFNRFFLLTIPPVSFLLPLLHFNLPAFWNRSLSGTPIHLLGVSRGNLEEVFTVYGNQQKTNWLTWELLLSAICLAVSACLIIRLVLAVLYLQKLKKNNPKQILPFATIYFVSEKGTPFSFFKSVFWSGDMDPDREPGRQILRHELFHVQQFHSFDNFYMEIISACCWFNPWFYGVSRELKAIHEYGADEFAAGDSDRFAYAGLLLSHVSGKTFSFTHPFFKNQIKRRIIMMTKQKKKAGWYGRILLLPLLLVIATLFSFRFQNISPKKTIRVVIDAGHGGVFTGSQFQNVQEKNVNLSIAKKIKSLSPSYNVEVTMSRDEDVSPGSNELTESLDYVASLAAKKNADLFISIHTNRNVDGNSESGFDIYIPGQTSSVFKGSMLLGTTIAGQIKPDYAVSSDLKQRPQQIHILDKASVPAVLIECGYLDNPADLKFITNEKNQEKIAGDILKGIREYNQNQEQVGNIIEPLILDTAYRQVEEEAQYPGGQERWTSYLMSHLKYPEAAVKKEIQGTVVVEFIVKKDGSIADVKAISGPESLKSEAVRAIKESGKWIPAKNNGAIVESYKKQPFNFKLG